MFFLRHFAICDCWEYCPYNHGNGPYGTLMQPYQEQVAPPRQENFTEYLYANSFNPYNQQWFIQGEGSHVLKNIDGNIIFTEINGAIMKHFDCDPANENIPDEGVFTLTPEIYGESLTPPYEQNIVKIFVSFDKGEIWQNPLTIIVEGELQWYGASSHLDVNKTQLENLRFYVEKSGEDGRTVKINCIRLKVAGVRLVPVSLFDPQTYRPIESGLGDLNHPMNILRVCPVCRYHSAQKPVEVRLK